MRAGIPDRQSQYAHSFMCMSASTLQLKSLSDTLRINAPYVYSEAAPESVRSGMPTSQQAAFPDLPRAVSKDPSGVNNVRVAELETLKGEYLCSKRSGHLRRTVACNFLESTCNAVGFPSKKE